MKDIIKTMKTPIKDMYRIIIVVLSVTVVMAGVVVDLSLICGSRYLLHMSVSQHCMDFPKR